MEKKLELEELKGQFIMMHLKGLNLAIADEQQEHVEVASALSGHVVKVTEKFLYIGPNPDTWGIIVAIKNIAVIELGIQEELEKLESKDVDVN